MINKKRLLRSLMATALATTTVVSNQALAADTILTATDDVGTAAVAANALKIIFDSNNGRTEVNFEGTDAADQGVTRKAHYAAIRFNPAAPAQTPNVIFEVLNAAAKTLTFNHNLGAVADQGTAWGVVNTAFNTALTTASGADKKNQELIAFITGKVATTQKYSFHAQFVTPAAAVASSALALGGQNDNAMKIDEVRKFATPVAARVANAALPTAALVAGERVDLNFAANTGTIILGGAGTATARFNHAGEGMVRIGGYGDAAIQNVLLVGNYTNYRVDSNAAHNTHNAGSYIQNFGQDNVLRLVATNAGDRDHGKTFASIQFYGNDLSTAAAPQKMEVEIGKGVYFDVLAGAPGAAQANITLKQDHQVAKVTISQALADEAAQGVTEDLKNAIVAGVNGGAAIANAARTDLIKLDVTDKENTNTTQHHFVQNAVVTVNAPIGMSAAPAAAAPYRIEVGAVNVGVHGAADPNKYKNGQGSYSLNVNVGKNNVLLTGGTVTRAADNAAVAATLVDVAANGTALPLPTKKSVFDKIIINSGKYSTGLVAGAGAVAAIPNPAGGNEVEANVNTHTVVSAGQLSNIVHFELETGKTEQDSQPTYLIQNINNAAPGQQAALISGRWTSAIYAGDLDQATKAWKATPQAIKFTAETTNLGTVEIAARLAANGNTVTQSMEATFAAGTEFGAADKKLKNIHFKNTSLAAQQVATDFAANAIFNEVNDGGVGSFSDAPRTIYANFTSTPLWITDQGAAVKGNTAEFGADLNAGGSHYIIKGNVGELVATANNAGNKTLKQLKVRSGAAAVPNGAVERRNSLKVEGDNLILSAKVSNGDGVDGAQLRDANAALWVGNYSDFKFAGKTAHLGNEIAMGISSTLDINATGDITLYSSNATANNSARILEFSNNAASESTATIHTAGVMTIAGNGNMALTSVDFTLQGKTATLNLTAKRFEAASTAIKTVVAAPNVTAAKRTATVAIIGTDGETNKFRNVDLTDSSTVTFSGKTGATETLSFAEASTIVGADGNGKETTLKFENLKEVNSDVLPAQQGGAIVRKTLTIGNYGRLEISNVANFNQDLVSAATAAGKATVAVAGSAITTGASIDETKAVVVGNRAALDNANLNLEVSGLVKFSNKNETGAYVVNKTAQYNKLKLTGDTIIIADTQDLATGNNDFAIAGIVNTGGTGVAYNTATFANAVEVKKLVVADANITQTDIDLLDSATSDSATGKLNLVFKSTITDAKADAIVQKIKNAIAAKNFNKATLIITQKQDATTPGTLLPVTITGANDNKELLIKEASGEYTAAIYLTGTSESHAGFATANTVGSHGANGKFTLKANAGTGTDWNKTTLASTKEGEGELVIDNLNTKFAGIKNYAKVKISQNRTGDFALGTEHIIQYTNSTASAQYTLDAGKVAEFNLDKDFKNVKFTTEVTGAAVGEFKFASKKDAKASFSDIELGGNGKYSITGMTISDVKFGASDNANNAGTVTLKDSTWNLNKDNQDTYAALNLEGTMVDCNKTLNLHNDFMFNGNKKTTFRVAGEVTAKNDKKFTFTQGTLDIQSVAINLSNITTQGNITFGDSLVLWANSSKIAKGESKSQDLIMFASDEIASKVGAKGFSYSDKNIMTHKGSIDISGKNLVAKLIALSDSEIAIKSKKRFDELKAEADDATKASLAQIDTNDNVVARDLNTWLQSMNGSDNDLIKSTLADFAKNTKNVVETVKVSSGTNVATEATSASLAHFDASDLDLGVAAVEAIASAVNSFSPEKTYFASSADANVKIYGGAMGAYSWYSQDKVSVNKTFIENKRKAQSFMFGAVVGVMGEKVGGSVSGTMLFDADIKDGSDVVVGKTSGWVVKAKVDYKVSSKVKASITGSYGARDLSRRQVAYDYTKGVGKETSSMSPSVTGNSIGFGGALKADINNNMFIRLVANFNMVDKYEAKDAASGYNATIEERKLFDAAASIGGKFDVAEVLSAKAEIGGVGFFNHNYKVTESTTDGKTKETEVTPDSFGIFGRISVDVKAIDGLKVVPFVEGHLNIGDSKAMRITGGLQLVGEF